MVVKLKRINKYLFIGLAVFALVLAALCIIKKENGSTSPAESGRMLRNKYEMVSYLNLLGLDVEESFTEESIIIPTMFNNIYTGYNEIQRTQGFDLDNYKGEPATAYTFRVKNYGKDEVYAVLLIHDGCLIGGDIRGLRDEFIEPLK